MIRRRIFYEANPMPESVFRRSTKKSIFCYDKFRKFFFCFSEIFPLNSWRFDVYNSVAAGIDHCRIAALCFPLISQRITMRMSMNEIAGMVRVNQTQKCVKPLMTLIGFIMNAERRRMRDHDVHCAAAREFIQPETGRHPKNFPAHLKFRKLFLTVIVPHAAFEPKNQHPVKRDQPIINVNTSAWAFDLFAGRGQHRAGVMIAVHVVEGDIECGHQKFQIIKRHISARKNHINSLKPFSGFTTV